MVQVGGYPMKAALVSQLWPFWLVATPLQNNVHTVFTRWSIFEGRQGPGLQDQSTAGTRRPAPLCQQTWIPGPWSHAAAEQCGRVCTHVPYRRPLGCKSAAMCSHLHLVQPGTQLFALQGMVARPSCATLAGCTRRTWRDLFRSTVHLMILLFVLAKVNCQLKYKNW